MARTAFVERGFAGTTMDLVAERARVSKASLYRAYPSKDDLLRAVIADWVDRGREAMRPHVEALLTASDVDAALLALARVLQAGILSPAVLGIRRLIMSEAARCPDIAALYLENSWRRNIAALAEAIAELDRRRTLRAPDPVSAAEQFTWLVIGAALNEHELRGGAAPRDTKELRGRATAAVETFLRRYRPDSA